jgi:hypothetical protein
MEKIELCRFKGKFFRPVDKLVDKSEIEQDFDNLKQKFIKAYEVFEKQSKNFDVRFNNRQQILHDLAKYVCSGLDFNQALMCIASDYNIDFYVLKNQLGGVNYEIKIIRLYAKYYTTKKMLAAGYTRQDIAKVLNISTKSVDRIKKCTVEL